jgi:cytoplasmic iron level regulating protein YaaA (DUF328/UPF0246 family)
MFIILSPAKTLDFDSPLGALPEQTVPRFLDDSQRLTHLLRDQSADDIGRLMKVSDKIAHLNRQRFADWRKDMSSHAARAAVFAFRGGVYAGLGVDGFDKRALLVAQSRLRILSGLYGLLRPLDRIRPYRLEMGTKLANERGHDLYDFWGGKLTRRLADDMANEGSDLLINLASREYFKVIDATRLPAQVVSPVFEDEKNGRYKVISFYAKKARGLMTAWILRHGISARDELSGFDAAGYAYSDAASTPDRPVFRRAENKRSRVSAQRR